MVKSPSDALYDILSMMRESQGEVCLQLVKLEMWVERLMDGDQSAARAVRGAMQDLRRAAADTSLNDHVDMVASAL